MSGGGQAVVAGGPRWVEGQVVVSASTGLPGGSVFANPVFANPVFANPVIGNSVPGGSGTPARAQLPAGAVVGLTGATGHIGQVLLERLLHQDVEVRSVARRPLAPPPEAPDAPCAPAGRVAHTCVDICSPGAREVLAGTDLVFHLAAQVWQGRAPGGREAMWQVNVEGTRNVLASAPRAVVLASSATVYGAWPDNPLPLSEGHAPRPNPECPYAEQKLAAEQVCRGWEGRGWDGRWTALRLGAVLGPHADLRVARALAGYRVAVPQVSGCPQATQWLDEGDAVDALLAAGTELLGPARTAGEVVNVATADWLSAPDMAVLARSRVLEAPRGLVMGAAELGRKVGLSPFGADRAALICGPLALSTDKAQELLSWTASRRSDEVFSAALARGWRGAGRNRA